MSELQYAENARTHNLRDGIGNSKSRRLAACFITFSRDIAALLQQLHGRRGDRMTVDGLLIGFVGIRVMLIRPIGANFDDPMKVAMTEVNLVSALIRTSG